MTVVRSSVPFLLLARTDRGRYVRFDPATGTTDVVDRLPDAFLARPPPNVRQLTFIVVDDSGSMRTVAGAMGQRKSAVAAEVVRAFSAAARECGVRVRRPLRVGRRDTDAAGAAAAVADAATAGGAARRSARVHRRLRGGGGGPIAKRVLLITDASEAAAAGDALAVTNAFREARVRVDAIVLADQNAPLNSIDHLCAGTDRILIRPVSEKDAKERVGAEWFVDLDCRRTIGPLGPLARCESRFRAECVEHPRVPPGNCWRVTVSQQVVVEIIFPSDYPYSCPIFRDVHSKTRITEAQIGRYHPMMTIADLLGRIVTLSRSKRVTPARFSPISWRELDSGVQPFRIGSEFLDVDEDEQALFDGIRQGK
jgi:hypothetical protein